MNYISTRRLLKIAILALLLLTSNVQSASAYGVLSHQAIVDAAWKKELLPLLKHRFPAATAEELRQAHAYAYGGSIIQDMGYFPFGNTFFTDLVHYMRSGDFVQNLINESENVNELAFALGALAHYNADIYGHPLGTNKAVPLVYPKVRKEHGDVVTYAEDVVSHVKTEFGFDVLQAARGHYAPEEYKNFIGFEVSRESLERAFLATYGLELGDVLASTTVAITTYRYTIKGFFPDLTDAAWQAKKDDIQAAQEDITKRKFTYRMRQTEFHEQWGKDYQKPNLFARILAWIIKILPKVGPLSSLGFKMPTPEAEKLFMESFNTTVDNYSAVLRSMRQSEPALNNMQLDTGEPTSPGTYKLTDETYAELLVKLEKNEFKHLTPALRKDILNFYEQVNEPSDLKAEKEDWEKVAEALQKLKKVKLSS
ncbi:zinc dependent phospholipase C family protein [Pontibacter harenae]|uniref:zinc dependent phospholipase C family protein n=1 Tax=Pontibacter harenae TaxID=2894083 RepID=UPI001E5BAC20|nr:zinc dependent phospholipase C family protein [Pontibacter harenae]MCC9168033.1 zinc dependent phospholipase C family protein [Pontibacter harenae]